jgi:hypothetical protein
MVPANSFVMSWQRFSMQFTLQKLELELPTLSGPGSCLVVTIVPGSTSECWDQGLIFGNIPH